MKINSKYSFIVQQFKTSYKFRDNTYYQIELQLPIVLYDCILMLTMLTKSAHRQSSLTRFHSFCNTCGNIDTHKHTYKVEIIAVILLISKYPDIKKKVKSER